MNAQYAPIRDYLKAQGAKLPPPAIVDKVRAAMAQLRTSAAAVPAARFTERPAPEEWSGNEVMAHVVEAGRFFGGSIVAVLDAAPPPVMPRERPPVAETPRPRRGTRRSIARPRPRWPAGQDRRRAGRRPHRMMRVAAVPR